jgi:hypothetical protein
MIHFGGCDVVAARRVVKGHEQMKRKSEVLERDPSQEDESDLSLTTARAAVLGASDWTAETILSQLRRGHIQLSPEFQRREAWTDQRKSTFIESLILGLPIPQLVFAESRLERSQYIVIDGKQRLLALLRFAGEAPEMEGYDTREPLRPTGLNVRKDLNGKTYSDMMSIPKLADDVSAFENQTIRTVVVKNWPNEAYLYTVFHRLNTASLPLSPQELRQALHPGKFVTFAATYSADSSALQSALGIDAPDFRMRDVEILVRFFAFSESLPTYDGNLKKFLDNTCDDLNKAWTKRERQIKALAARCDAAIEATIEVFGDDDAFTRWNGSAYEGRFNRAVFDVMTYYFKEPEIAKAAVSRRARVRKAFERLCTDADFASSIQTTTKSVGATATRLQKWGDALSKVIEPKFVRPKLVGRRIQV